MLKRNIFLFVTSIIVILAVGVVAVLKLKRQNWPLFSPAVKKEEIREKPLLKYEYEKLIKRGGKPSQLVLERVIKKEAQFTSYLFSFTSEGKKITGLANIPQGAGKFPVIVQLRGYVDKENYATGVGTKPSGEVYSSAGFITLAPDYLGYGESEMPPNNVWEERFLRIVNVLDLLESLKTLPQLDSQKVGLWGHSNGGLAALTILALTGKDYPTSLWAPVSQYFPYDVLYYTWEADDRGKSLRKLLAEFETEYDTDRYSYERYFERIHTPVQLHQGTGDAYIPLSWSNNLADKLREQNNEVNYYTYPGVDHNLRESWDTVVQRDLDFFREKLLQ